MQIHNVYSDLSFFLSHVLNTILNDKIKKFKYNLGNVSFMLNYDPNYELPIAIINFIGLTPFNTRMSTFHKNLTTNVYLIPVLYNRNKDISLQLQEDLYYVDYSVNINCESQLHAIEIKHNLENFLPVGKLLNFLKFCSFFEIDEVFLNKYLFDVNNDDIDNLFLVHNKITDNLVYCFSTEYYPLIRLESIDLSIQDIAAATFTVTASFKILTHLPSKLLFNKPLLKDYTSTHLLKHDNIKLPVNPNYEYYLLNDDKLIYIKSSDTIFTDSASNIFNLDRSNKYVELGEFHSIFQNVHIDGKIEIHHYETNNIGVKISTYDKQFSNSILKNVEFLEDNKIKALVNYKNSFEEIYLIYSLHKVKRQVTITETNNNYNIKYYTIIKPNEVYSAVRNINKYKAEINYEETKITGYNNIVLHNSVKLNGNGEFTISNNNIVINGEIDLKSGKVNIFNILNSDLSVNTDLELIYLNVNLVFTLFDVRGSGYIEKINFDVTNTFNNSISTVSVMSNEHVSYNKNIKNILVDKINLIENNKETNIITFGLFNNINIIDDSDFSFYFTKTERLINSHTNFIIFKEFSNNQLIFTTSSKFYFENLVNVNNVYPLILKIGF